MNQKEYELIAEVLKNFYKTYNVPYMQYHDLVIAFELKLQMNYPKTFDASKFLERTGLK